MGVRLTPFGLDPALPSFHRCTRLAKALFQAEQAFIVLIENGRVWRSRDPSGQFPSRSKIVEHVVESGEVLWLEDAMADARFDPANFVFESFRTRFYAAAPICLADGAIPGVLVVLDRQPRPFSPPLVKRLQDLAATVADECDRAYALEAIKRSEERLQLALELAEIRVADVDLERGTVDAAGAAETFFDHELSFDEMTSDALAGVHPEDRARVASAWRRLVQDDAPYDVEFRTVSADDRDHWARGVMRVFRDERGRVTRYVSATQNITAQKHLERVLQQAKDEAEAANQAKSTFLATMSHEIRTPLNGVLGMAQVMARDELAPAQRERLELIQRSGEALLVILNDLLDLSKVEAGKLELERTDFDLEALARSVHDIFGPIAQAKNCTFRLDVDPAVAGVYRGDPTRIRQILGNLISNALKFTDQGEVGVSITGAAGGLQIQVSDSGIGISGDQMQGLFQKFQQADSSTTRRFGGTGLGLAICHELATLMGGSISAESRLGEGSTFTLVLPLQRVGLQLAAAALNPAAHAAARRLRILAAEDNPVNQLVLRALLDELGEVEIVGTGGEALAAWEKDHWDVILMDIHMPQMDGRDATREIRRRETEWGRRRTPIVALTADAMDHQVAEFLAVGMDGFVAKPLQLAQLFSAIEAATGCQDARAG